MIQCGEVGSAGLQYTWPDSTPGWLTYRSGLVIVVFFTLCCIYPLSLLPNMRKLEMVGGFGIIIIWFLMFVIIVYACQNGLPALKQDMFGGFATVNQGSVSDVANAFSLFGFAFYLQAIMMPLLGEMPPGRTGAKITNTASMVTVIGVAATTYIVTAFFGAAMYGYDNTSSNILDNQWFGSYTVLEDGTLVPGDGGAGQFVLNFLMTVYLAISLPPIVFAMCLPVNNWMVMASRGRYENLRPFTRQLINVTIIILVCLAVSLGAPGSSGDVLTVTGATGVCLVSYLIPVLSHLMLVFGKARCQRLDPADSGSVYGGAVLASRQPSSLEDGLDPSKKLDRASAGGPRAGPKDSAAPLASDGEPLALERVSFREPTLPGRVPERFPIAPIRERYSVNLGSDRDGNASTPPAPGMERLGSDDLTMTQIGYFALPREYHAPKHGRIYFWVVEVTVPIAVLALGVLFSVATLVLLVRFRARSGGPPCLRPTASAAAQDPRGPAAAVPGGVGPVCVSVWALDESRGGAGLAPQQHVHGPDPLPLPLPFRSHPAAPDHLQRQRLRWPDIREVPFRPPFAAPTTPPPPSANTHTHTHAPTPTPLHLSTSNLHASPTFHASEMMHGGTTRHTRALVSPAWPAIDTGPVAAGHRSPSKLASAADAAATQHRLLRAVPRTACVFPVAGLVLGGAPGTCMRRPPGKCKPTASPGASAAKESARPGRPGSHALSLMFTCLSYDLGVYVSNM